MAFSWFRWPFARHRRPPSKGSSLGRSARPDVPLPARRARTCPGTARRGRAPRASDLPATSRTPCPRPPGGWAGRFREARRRHFRAGQLHRRRRNGRPGVGDPADGSRRNARAGRAPSPPARVGAPALRLRPSRPARTPAPAASSRKVPGAGGRRTSPRPAANPGSRLSSQAPTAEDRSAAWRTRSVATPGWSEAEAMLCSCGRNRAQPFGGLLLLRAGLVGEAPTWPGAGGPGRLSSPRRRRWRPRSWPSRPRSGRNRRPGRLRQLPAWPSPGGRRQWWRCRWPRCRRSVTDAVVAPSAVAL